MYANIAPWSQTSGVPFGHAAETGSCAICARRHLRYISPDTGGTIDGGGMDGGDAVAQNSERRRAGEPAFRRRGGLPAGARSLCGPRVVTGWVLLIAFGRHGPLGVFFERTFGLVFAFRWTGAALAAAIMGFPLMVRAIRLSLEAVDRRLEDAAATLGAGPARIFLTVTLPLSLPGVGAGLILGFAKAVGEFGATITFVANIPGETQTLATAIYNTTQDPDGTSATWRLTAVAVIIAVVALTLSEGLANRLARAR
jgi:molybdate transport system permease protein